uniref:HAT C-terminal dimerisation domain-containing protein n=1 Tax=Arundo donax TaxID=35708 RepID=A0A0A9HGG1_ARUDO
MLIETKKHLKHDVVYKLLKLVLQLSVAIASVERVFYSINYMKNKLRNRMEDQYLNDCFVIFIERGFFFAN